MIYRTITAEEAAEYIKDGELVGIGGFSSVGVPKAVPAAIARKAEVLHSKGIPFKIGLITGGASGEDVDGVLARAHALSLRTPFQSNRDMRKAINNGEIRYFDLHLSKVAEEVRYGYAGYVDTAIIEVAGFTTKGEVILTTSVGITPTLVEHSKHLIIEWNHAHNAEKLYNMHDLFEIPDPSLREPIPIYKVWDRVGSKVLKIDPAKVIGVVETNCLDHIKFTPVDDITTQIGNNVGKFLVEEWRRGLIPRSYLPIQSGVGNIANAVLSSLETAKEIPNFNMFTEVIQDAVIDLMEKGRVTYATGCSLTLSESHLKKLYDNIDLFRDKILLRPQEITNHPEVIRRLGVIAMNTAVEVDLYGHVNSTHAFGSKLINGIGGSGDYARNAFISIFMCPSTAKNGLISTIVPMVTHVDSTEHDVSVIVTEQGIADLRGKAPEERAKAIIEHCAHPDYRPFLRAYLKIAEKTPAHEPVSLINAFRMQEAFLSTGDMKNVEFV